MKELEFSHFIYKLYIGQATFVGYYDSYENAETFAIKYYKGSGAFIVPIEVFTLKKE